MLITPVDRIRCLLVVELRDPARVSSLPVQPSPFVRRVGVHDFTFEACSSFTRVTACKVAHPPFVGFIARLRPDRFPALRANIDETVPPVIITEQGENRNQCEEQRNIFGFSHGFACR